MALYKWKKFGASNNEAELYNSADMVTYELSFENFSDEVKSLTKSFSLNYKNAEIPKFNNRLLIDLMARHDLSVTIEEFVTIGCALQYQWMMNSKLYEKDDELLNDFDKLKKGYKSLFDILEKFLFADNQIDLHSISFKFNSSGTTKVNNFFVLKELYDAMCLGYGINKDNFHKRKGEILSSTNQVILSKLGEKTKYDYAQVLYHALRDEFSKDADALKFIGAFFHIFQVPTNNSHTRDLLYKDITETLEIIDIKNFRHYIVGRKSLYH
ncbi:hypothetical protein [Flavobacterium agrisoli]|uniref:Uncharacterized protein n=1 Tax=Flavobacterium agrisoli TaxID=2793066 RepID=A0A934PNM3_9FLAO|nr:hypothetical protein [Flavobacterium agrisoli]MBK0369801.1 hypothetical protein [Flavobacterium agrisoli]